MDWMQRMNHAISYIEDNLIGTIDYLIIAKKAFCSVYHFQRMFSSIAGIPLSEYIRRRRLTLAAFDIQSSSMKIIDIALKYGYNSPESFTRAFHKMHGVTPTTARAKGIALGAYPRISFQLFVKGVEKMNYRIEHTKSSKVFGKSIEVSYDDGKHYEVIKQFVHDSLSNGTAKNLLEVVGLSMDTINTSSTEELQGIPVGGLFVFYEHTESSLKFMLGGDYNKEELPSNFEVIQIPESTWVVFSMHGSHNTNEALNTIDHIWKRVGEWFQTSEYEHRTGVAELEKRYKLADGYLAEVWIPVIKK